MPNRAAHRPRSCPAAALLIAALALCALAALPGRARANGVPARIQLSYLPNLSNFGPADATGEVELSYAEGIVRLNARGLQPLDNGSYELWLVKSATNAAIGGFFTPIQKPDSNALITSDTQPATLPNTGDPPAAIAAAHGTSAATRHEAAAALFAVGLVALYSTFRLRRDT